MRSTTIALGMAGVLLTAVSGPPPAQAAEPSYVALGDSYASGTGTRSYLNDGTDCLRSVYAYPSLIAAGRGYGLNFRACSGATVSDVTSTQLGAITTGTNYISVSVGGNDAGFADVLTECALPAWFSDCYGAIDDARSHIRSVLPGDLATLYAQIDRRAPGATVVVVGYPRIFNGQDCSPLTWFSRSEQSALNGTGVLLNRITADVAADAGFAFANPSWRFRDHAVCDDDNWLNGLTLPLVESFHPNRTGHASGYARVVSPRLTGAVIAVSASTLRQARSSAKSQARRQSLYAERDRSIEAETVGVPDLTSVGARRAAQRYGVDLSSRASIDRADRRESRLQARQWRSRH